MAHRLAPEAEAELDEIWLYTARKSGSIEIADRLIDSLTERLYLLSRNPHMGRRHDHDLRPGLRSFPVGEYVIVYRIDGEDVLFFTLCGVAETSKLCSAISARPVRRTANQARVLATAR